MRYLDSGARAEEEALGYWLRAILQSKDVIAVRWQSGYFVSSGLGLMLPTLQRIRDAGGEIVAVIGSNQGETLARDVENLIPIMGVPRKGAHLGVAFFAGALFHPKTYHFTRRDGSQAAYVGSANLTFQGVSGANIEAGLVVDTRDGDDPLTLNAIKSAVDAWFQPNIRPGLTVIDSAQKVAELLTSGLLAAVPQRTQSSAAGSDGKSPSAPRLKPLVTWPDDELGLGKALNTAAIAPAATPKRILTETRGGYPYYLLFDPASKATPTSGASALTGNPLPESADGLIIRLNRDSARHFSEDSKGTANITVPVSTLGTIRFGIYQGRHSRPRAEFNFIARYIGVASRHVTPEKSTSIMVYGYAEGETGNKDVRLTVPAAVRSIRTFAISKKLKVPERGDLALLEWPTRAAPRFGLTLMDKQTDLYQKISELYNIAKSKGALVGQSSEGSALLARGTAPAW